MELLVLDSHTIAIERPSLETSFPDPLQDADRRAPALPPAQAATGPRTSATSPIRGTVMRLARKLAHVLVVQLPWGLQDRIYFLATFRRWPNLRQPRTFNEKVLYRKRVYGDHPTYRRLADKFAVRAHVAARVGRQYLIPLLHDTTDPASLLERTQWQRTVIKSSHGSGMVALMLDEPDQTRRQALVADCQRWLRTDFSKAVREIHYRGIPPRLLVEQYIGDGAQPPVDYKFHMFRQRDGRFQYVLQVIYRSSGAPLSMTFFVNSLSVPFHGIRDAGLSPPCTGAQLQHALELSKALAAEFDYVRVDWYIQAGRIYFGELTFTPGAGLVTGLDKGLDALMGQMWVQRVRPALAVPRRPAPALQARPLA